MKNSTKGLRRQNAETPALGQTRKPPPHLFRNDRCIMSRFDLSGRFAAYTHRFAAIPERCKRSEKCAKNGPKSQRKARKKTKYIQTTFLFPLRRFPSRKDAPGAPFPGRVYRRVTPRAPNHNPHIFITNREKNTFWSHWYHPPFLTKACWQPETLS